MERKIVGQLSMMIAMAKHIKASAKGLKDNNMVNVTFAFDLKEETTGVIFNDRCLVLNEKCSVEDIRRLTESALKESVCDGVLYGKGTICKVLLYGKPVKPFNMLQRLVKKYAGVYIEREHVKSVCYDVNGNEVYDKTVYLCYNGEECQKGVDFIRKHRTSKDVLKVDFVYDTETDGKSIVIGLGLSVETPHGKNKGEITLVP